MFQLEENCRWRGAKEGITEETGDEREEIEEGKWWGEAREGDLECRHLSWQVDTFHAAYKIWIYQNETTIDKGTRVYVCTCVRVQQTIVFISSVECTRV